MIYLELLRPNLCILSVIGLVVGAIITSAYVLEIIPAMIAVFLITGAGNTINDYFDHKIDKINAPTRPIPSGRITREKVLKYFLMINTAGLVISAFVSHSFFVLALINSVILYLYSWKFKRALIIGNLMVSWLAASTFIAAGFLSGFSLPFALLVLFSISFLGTLSREILGDVEDIEGDKKMGSRTLPIIAGEKLSSTIAYIILLAGVAALFIPLYYSIFSYYYLIGIVPAIVTCIYTIKANDARKSQKYIKIAMFLVMVGFILGSVL